MSVSTKELFTAFFKGLAFAKGLNFGEKNRGMAEDRWITIHPWGMSQGEADAGEGKGYYRRIEINDETGEIEKGLGAGTNIKDLSKTLKAKKNGQENESTSKKTVKEPTTLRDKIKALTDGKEYTEEVANKVGDLMRQELEKNKDFKALVDDIDYKRSKFDEIQNKINEFNKTYMTRAIRLEEKDPDVVAYDKTFEEYRKDYHSGKIDYDTFYQKTSDADFMALKEKRDNAVNKIYAQLDKERNALGDLREYLVDNKETMNKMIGIFREQFKDVIEFADTKNMYLSARDDSKSKIKSALSIFPQDFVNLIPDKNVKFNVGRTGRANYSDVSGTISISPYDSEAIIAHEFSHCIEHNIPGILKIEQDFYERRTKGEKLISMNKAADTTGYKVYEKTRIDKFLDPYMGKDYAYAYAYAHFKNVSRWGERFNAKDVTEKPEAYELLSMGVQTMLESPEKIKQDKDYFNFVFGCLAYKGK